MNKIQQVIGALENEKDWCGMDISLDISLFEYGIIWKIEGDKVKFIFTVAEEDDSRVVIHEAVYDLNTDPQKEWGWAVGKGIEDYEAKGFLTTHDMTREEFLEMPFTQQVYFLFRYYGEYEIFGTDCPCRVIEFKD
jgi:hypothetical protein